MSNALVTSTDDFYAALSLGARLFQQDHTPLETAQVLSDWVEESVNKRYSAADSMNMVALDYARPDDGWNGSGLPTGLLMVRRDAHYSFPIVWTARTMVIDDHVTIVLSAENAGERIAKTILGLAADFFAEEAEPKAPAGKWRHRF